MINDCDSKRLQNKHKKPQVQLETQVTPVLPQKRLVKFVDDDLMLCHRGKRETHRWKERMCIWKLTTITYKTKIGERDNYKQIKPEYLRNISVNRTEEHAWPNLNCVPSCSSCNRIWLKVASVRGSVAKIRDLHQRELYHCRSTLNSWPS